MMSWRPIFVHEFLDRRLDNVNGVEGDFLTSSQPPPVGHGSMSLFPGAWFTYRLRRPRADVIGLDVTYRIHAPAGSINNWHELLTIPGAFSLKLRFSDPTTSEVIDGDSYVHADLVVGVGGATTIVEQLPIPYRFATELRVAWHTSGQLHVWMDSVLWAYQPGIQPGVRLTLHELSCGDVGSAPLTGKPIGPDWSVYRLTVRALDETDVVDSVVGELPLDDLDDVGDSERCRVEALHHARAITDHYRALMQKFIAGTTRPWQHSATPNSTAFDQSAVRAHAAATAAFSALMTYFRDGDDTARVTYLEQLYAFLSELHREAPQAFTQLLNDLENMTPPRQVCLDLAKQSLAGHEPTIQMLAELADETMLAAHNIVGGSDG